MEPVNEYRVNSALVAAEVFDAEAIIMNLNDGMYYTLVGTGAEIWSLIERHQDLSTISAYLAKKHGMSEDVCHADLLALVAELAAEKLIVPHDGPAGDMDIGNPGDFGAYAKPSLVHHADMTDILAMDPPLPEPMQRKAE